MLLRCASLLLLLLVSPALSYFSFQEQIPNGNNVNHPCKVNYRWAGVGHQNPLGGGSRNTFGKDFNEIGGRMWTQRLCQMDSDGDGRTNGDELGDPSCIWRPGQIPTRTTDISHPGVCEPYGEGICAGRDDFVDCEVSSFEKCDILNEQDIRTVELRFPTVKVPNTETNYFCMTFDIPSDADYHMVAYEAIIDNRDVMHHIVMSGCEDGAEATSSAKLCSMGDDSCFSIIGLWAVGFPGKCIGDNLGIRIGTKGFKRVKLEFHYNNPKLVSDYTDSSGMKLYYRPARPEVMDLKTLVVGQTLLEIPPGQREVKIEGSCPGDCTAAVFTEPVYVVEAINHMHYLGRSMKVEVFRNGRWLVDLTNEEFYSYDSPTSNLHNPPVELLPGDEIKTTCVFNSLSSKRWVYYGDGTSDEMCFAFLFVYPTTSLQIGWCAAHGPLSTCDRYVRKPIDGCNWGTFVNTSHDHHREVAFKLEKNCNLDGFCRPECEEVLEDIEDHECLNGEAGRVVKDFLKDEPEGLKMLGRLHSCAKDSSGHDTHHTPAPQDCSDQCRDFCDKDDDGWEAATGAGSQRGVASLLTLAVATLCALLVLQH